MSRPLFVVISVVAAAAVFLAAAAVVRSEPADEGSSRPAKTQPSKDQPPASRPADEVLGQMLKPRRQGQERELTWNEPPATDRTSGDGAVKPHAPVLTVVREGTPLVNRLGRLTTVAGPEGTRAEFNFEADGQALRDPPLILLPNLNLMSMEDAVRSAGRDLRFRVSGVVTEYRGRNYLLLEKVTVVQDLTQQYKPM